jgi:polyisoprenoid-binding protein YceI
MSNEAENLGNRYRIDARRSEFTVQAFSEGMLSFMGHNPTFAVRRYGGEVQFASGNQSVDSMLLVIETETLTLLDRVKEKDAAEIENAMLDDVLETHQFPEIVFVSKNIKMRQTAQATYLAEISGELSLHGVTLRNLIEVEAEFNNRDLRARGEFWLRQSDYNIEQFKALGGSLKVKDAVKISFDIAAQI